MKRGRQTIKTPEICAKIVERLSVGEPLESICRENGMPASRTVRLWRSENADFDAEVARARDEGFGAIAVEALEILDTEPDRLDDGRVDPGMIRWRRDRFDGRLKLLACWDPRKYGNKITHGGDDDNPIQHEHKLDFSAMSPEMRDILRKDLEAKIDSEVSPKTD